MGEEGVSCGEGVSYAEGDAHALAGSGWRWRGGGWAESREGMSLLMVALAFLARTSLRVAAGARPREGLVRPMVGVELVSWGCWGCLGRGVFLSDGDVMVLFETTVEKKMRVPCRVMQRCGEAGEVHE